jgi:hypothetical protein
MNDMEVVTQNPFLRNGVLEKLGEKILEEISYTPSATIECSSEETSSSQPYAKVEYAR